VNPQHARSLARGSVDLSFGGESRWRDHCPIGLPKNHRAAMVDVTSYWTAKCTVTRVAADAPYSSEREAPMVQRNSERWSPIFVIVHMAAYSSWRLVPVTRYVPLVERRPARPGCVSSAGAPARGLASDAG
jgi:hypothetical protein